MTQEGDNYHLLSSLWEFSLLRPIAWLRVRYLTYKKEDSFPFSVPFLVLVIGDHVTDFSGGQDVGEDVPSPAVPCLASTSLHLPLVMDVLLRIHKHFNSEWIILLYLNIEKKVYYKNQTYWDMLEFYNNI